VTVLVVDDHPSFRAAACALLAAMPGFEVVAEAATGEEAVEIASRIAPAFILLDVHLPGIDGPEACRRIKALGNTAEILFVAADEDALPALALDACSGPFGPTRRLTGTVIADAWHAARWGDAGDRPRDISGADSSRATR